MYFGGYTKDEEKRVHSQHERYSLTMRVRGCALQAIARSLTESLLHRPADYTLGPSNSRRTLWSGIRTQSRRLLIS